MKIKNGLVKTENIGMGIVGAFIGSLAGVILIILLDMVGFVASLAGFVMGYATFYMYEKLAGTISKKGVIICILVMILMTLIGENISWSIAISKGANIPFKDVLSNFYEIIKLDSSIKKDYLISLVMVYLFNVVGAFGIIREKIELIKNN